VRDLSDDLGDGYAMEYAGPLPPFEFTDLSSGEHAPARPRWGW
jgi:hypothetical protein